MAQMNNQWLSISTGTSSINGIQICLSTTFLN